MIGIALILDPCSKKQFFSEVIGWQDEWIEGVMESFKDAYSYYKGRVNVAVTTEEAVQAQAGLTDSSAPDRDYINYLKRKRFHRSGGVGDRGEEEYVRYVLQLIIHAYVRYLNAPLAEPGSNALTFWKMNVLNYPIFSAMAMDYLAIQASSVPSERAFSSGVDLVTPNRCRLEGNTIEMIQFLKFNM
jgi:hypothetical protein